MPLPDDFKITVGRFNDISYARIPDGLYTLEIQDISLIKQATYLTFRLPDDKKEYEDVISIEFAILNDIDITPDNDPEKRTTRGRRVWKRIKPYVVYEDKKNNKSASNLYTFLKFFYGNAIQKGDIDKDLLDDLIGKQVNAIVKGIETSTGKLRYDFNLEALLPVTAKMQLESYLNDPENPKNIKKDETEG